MHGDGNKKKKESGHVVGLLREIDESISLTRCPSQQREGKKKKEK